MLTLLIFIAVLGLLVFVHELGHFVVAKRSGMRVDEFGFGFPPRLIGVYRTAEGAVRVVYGARTPQDAVGTTIYSLNAIPLGGFVKIVGENNDEADDPNSFVHKPFLARLATLLAGVTMNVVLAWVLFSIVLAAGVPTVVDDPTLVPAGARVQNPRTTIIEVRPESPALEAGLRAGDVVLSIDDQTFAAADATRSYILDRKGATFAFRVERDGRAEVVHVASLASPGENQGPTGIALATVGSVSYPWYRAPLVGLRVTAEQLWEVAAGLGKLVSGGVGLNQVGGPVKIAQLTGEASRLGFAHLLQFAAFLSLNLAVLNALPIPALDGGRVLFLVVEKVRGKRNNAVFEQTVNAIGFLALLLLMLVVTINDFNGFSIIGRLFGK